MYNSTVNTFTLVRPHLEQQHVKTITDGGRTQGEHRTQQQRAQRNTPRKDTLQHDSWGLLITRVPYTDVQRTPSPAATILSEALYTHQTKDTPMPCEGHSCQSCTLLPTKCPYKTQKQKRAKEKLPREWKPHLPHTCTPEIAFTTVDFPCATCPMVPMLMVAWRLMTSGVNGVSFDASRVSKS